MKEEIKVPSVGESITTGVIVAWLKQNGDFVQDGDILFELETDKAVLEIPSTGSGTLEIVVEAASEVSIGQTVALLDAGDAAAQPAAAPQHEAAAAEDQKGNSQVLSPAVRRTIAEHNLDPIAITGTGKGGRITKEDALRAAERQKDSGQAAQEAVTPTPAAPPPAAAPGKIAERGCAAATLRANEPPQR